MFKIILKIYGLIIFLIGLCLFVTFFPVKFAVKEIPKETFKNKKNEVYIIRQTDVTDGGWVADKEENKITNDMYFVTFNNKLLEENIPLTIDCGDDNFIGENRFIIYGKSHLYIKEAENYAFELEKWDIIYPIIRKPNIYCIFASRRYLTILDYILYKI